MKKTVYIAFISAYILSSCSSNAVEKVDEPPADNPSQIVEKDSTISTSPTLEVEASQFQFVVGWLSEDEIAYVENDDTSYRLKVFNIHSNESRILYEEKERITESVIHRSKEYILLHTGDDPTSATIKILRADGSLLNEVTIESTELSIVWNEKNPSLILLTAFHEDWTFDLFLYDSKESELTLLPSDDPFPSWIGPIEIAFNDEEQPPEGSDIRIYNPITETFEGKDFSNEIFMSYHDGQLLTMGYIGEKMHFVLRDMNGQFQSEWSLPQLPNRLIPLVEWISTDELIIYSPESDYAFKENNNLIHIFDGGQSSNAFDIKTRSVKCSPSGKVCIVGENEELLIWLETNEKKKWITIAQ